MLVIVGDSSKNVNRMKQPRYKRPFDLVVLAVAHIALLPVILLLWIILPIVIWLEDRGPVFYHQERFGKDGISFILLKFRTMVKGADKIGLGWTSENDPRVTRVGRIIRRTALDELPQVINILRGDISFVGPRALPPKMHKEMTMEEPSFPLRLKVRPGLTGLAQLRLPRHCPPRRRLRYDLRYIKKQTFGLDIKIIMQSAWMTLAGRWGTGSWKAVDTTNRYTESL